MLLHSLLTRVALVSLLIIGPALFIIRDNHIEVFLQLHSLLTRVALVSLLIIGPVLFIIRDNHIEFFLQLHSLLTRVAIIYFKQGLHRLEKYLNLEGLLEKYSKIKYALKSTGKSLKNLEQS